MSRLNPLTELTHPLGNLERSMGRLEESIGKLHSEMAPIGVLHEMNDTLKRMEALMERLVAAQEQEQEPVSITPPRPASRRGAQRARGA
jgi:hypothetical protein